MILHDQIPGINSMKIDTCINTTETFCSHNTLSNIHEQIHSYTISFDNLNILLIEYFEADKFFTINFLYNFISFHLPYRPPSYS